MQRFPITVLPDTPVQDAMIVCSPMVTLCPIWIWLSSLTPSIGVPFAAATASWLEAHRYPAELVQWMKASGLEKGVEPPLPPKKRNVPPPEPPSPPSKPPAR